MDMSHISVPPVTLASVAICTAVQFYVFFWEPVTLVYALDARAVLFGGEFYRILTAPFFHGGWLHLLMNMSSALAVSSWLERSIGSVQLSLLITWAVILGGAIACCLELVSSYYRVMVGYSGVLFTIAVLEAQRSSLQNRQLFGISVPTKYYPWALMALLQLMLPSISWEGHLAGGLVGLIFHYGGSQVFLPSADFTKRMECRCLSSVPAFVHCPMNPWPQSSENRPGACCDFCRSAAGGACTVVAGIGEIVRDACAVCFPRRADASGEERAALVRDASSSQWGPGRTLGGAPGVSV